MLKKIAKKSLISLGVIVAVFIIIFGFFAYTRSGLYRNYVKIKKPDAIFISAADNHAVTKYALIGYFRNNPSICERLERPYKPFAPEEPVDFQRDTCRGQIKDIRLLVETFNTKNATVCEANSAFRSGGLASGRLTDNNNGYAFINKACTVVATVGNFDSALRAYLSFIPSTGNFHCNSDASKRGDICPEYAESTDRLIQLYHLLEQNPDSITL